MKRLSETAIKFALLLMSGMFVSAPNVSAEETVKSGNVYVTATRIEKELQDVPMSVTVMTSEDVKHSTARSVGELLQDVPGVQVQSDGSQGLKRISIRGENAFRTLVLIDGQKISEHKSMSGAPILIDPARIERIEVIKGPASVLYGSDAIGGVINIITKKGGKKALEGNAYVEYSGASEGFTEGLSVAGAKNGWEYRLSGSYADHGNIHTPIGTFDNTGFRQKDFSGFLSKEINEHLVIGGAVDYFKGSFNSTSLEQALDPNADFFVNVPGWTRQKYSAFVELKDLTDYLPRVRVDAYYQDSQKQMRNFIGNYYHKGDKFEFNGMPITLSKDGHMIIDNTADNTIITKGASIQADWQLGENHYLITGYDIAYDELESFGDSGLNQKLPFNMGPMPTQMAMNTHTFKYYDGTQLSQSLFASMETYLPYDFTLSYGVRWTHVKTELTRGDEYKYGTLTTPVPGRPPVIYDGKRSGGAMLGSDSNSRPVFNVGLVWTGIENLALRATWAQGFRVPNLTEKYVGSAMGGGTIIGNPNLDPETSNNFEVGARWNNGVTNLDLAFFYAISDNYIARFEMKPNEFHFQNVSKATTFGSELALSHDINTSFAKFTPYTTITWMRREFDDGKGFTTYKTDNPNLVGRYGLRMEKAINENLDITADLYGRSQSATESETASHENDNVIGGFTTANFAMGVDFGKDKKYNVTAEVLNIFDKEYKYTDAMLEPGVHFNLKLNMNF